MQEIRQLAQEIVAREGGFVNDPADPGGATKYGVTLATLQGLRRDLTGDGRVTLADLRALTRDQAAEIFIQHYFHAPRLGDLPVCLQPAVFDMQVNAGRQAIRILQRLLTRLGWPLVADGQVGPRTAAAAQAAAQAMPEGLADAYGAARRDYYYALGDQRPASRKYCLRRDGGKGGWIRRAEEFIHPRNHLTDAQHRERTKSWG